MKIYGTAKGGALSKKDFGVAFGGNGVAPCVEATYTWSDSTSDNPIGITNGVQSAGMWVRAGDLVGATIKTLTQKMYRHVDPASGNMICHQINSGDTGAIKSTSDPIAISEISSTSTSYSNATSITFTFDDPAEIAVNDCFIVSSDGSAFKLWVSTGNEDSSNTNIMESDDADPPSFTEKATLTARGSALYCEA